AEKFMKEAEAAESGEVATGALKQAQKAYERAEKAHPAGDAARKSVECLKGIRKEADYAKLMSDAQKLSYEADKIAGSEYSKRFEALVAALKPLYEAQVLFKRAEVSNEIKRIDTKAAECKAAI